jgi:protein-S-isoprenylcysteine O-methyltransferase Ste14
LEIYLLDSVRFAHLIGLAVGLGMAFAADVTAVSTLWRPITAGMVAQLRRLHAAVFAGFALLWVSGLGLVYLKTGFAMAEMTPKLTVKFTVVAILTLNAGLIGLIGLPKLGGSIGRSFGELAAVDRMVLSLIAGLSAASWGSALALGVFTPLKTMGMDQLVLIFGQVFAVCALGAGLLAVFAPLLTRKRYDWIDRPLDPRGPQLAPQKPYVG